MIVAPRALLLLGGAAFASFAQPAAPLSPTNIFAPVSTPAQSIFELSRLVLMVTAAIFIVVFSLLAYAAVKFRRRRSDDLREPAQAYGSTQLELAWTVAPVLIVMVLFLASARVIASRTRYSPVPQCSGERSGTSHPTVLKLISVDTDHSFWAPRLAGKTDLIPNHPNTMWVEPHEIGLYLG